MDVSEKIARAEENHWLADSLSAEERAAAEFIASIAVSIQRRRHALGITQKVLADKLGVSQVMVSRWENGEENFTAATLAKISNALGLELHNPFENQARAV
ncbi:MAG: helix-turn-helix transcriptional regulator [Synergistaceae bacterium]|jgi:ribosome-binding protein aMBF1 (putative translation factor)|nr:helix-turn-helix transcriptional regulator [Synergistaceae bacterium]